MTTDRIDSLVCTLKPYIQPFERLLAMSEMEALTGSTPTVVSRNRPTEYRVTTEVSPTFLAARLAYWEHVASADFTGRYTNQSRKEATSALAQNGVALRDIGSFFPVNGELSVSLPRRRCLRYGPHGLHEYRGKFFPQLVTSLLNIACTSERDVLVDPMCGSGTTLVEGTMLGLNCFGLDMNPLSVFMTRTKTGILKQSPSKILKSFEQIEREGYKNAIKDRKARAFFKQIPEPDYVYLNRWFEPRILKDLGALYTTIVELPCSVPIKRLYFLSLSNILRKLSWQKNDDLRVRKEIWDTSTADVYETFLAEAERSVRLCVSCAHAIRGFSLGSARVLKGDAREWSRCWRNVVPGSVDVVITSPPYATALPYLDTDRLSLIFLGLLNREKHRNYDLEMIGNREITKSLRKKYHDEFRIRQKDLPQSVCDLVTTIERLNEGSSVGFRRQNVSSLLSKYFFDMLTVLQQTYTMLKVDAPAFFVVGDNHTIAGGQRVDINTTELLSDMAERVGFDVEDRLPMEMLVSRDIFRGNASSSETVLSFRKKTR